MAELLDGRFGVADESIIPASAPSSNAISKRTKRTRKRRGGCGSCGSTVRRRALSAAKALAHWAGDKGKTTSTEVRERRLALCEGCPLFDEAKRQCSVCECYIDYKIKLRKEVCPAGKWLQETDNRRPLVNPTKHLIYHIYPVSGNGWWEWNVAQLLERIELFDGVRSVAIMTPRKRGLALDSVEQVQKLFEGHRIDNWIIKQNNPNKREQISHAELLETLPHGEQEITFSGHAKGIRNESLETYAGSVQHWTRIMYRVCLDDLPSVESALEDFLFAGSFRRYNTMACKGWHYSGSFYWFRNDPKLFESGLVSGRWWATESWPGDVCEHHEAACLFGEGVNDLYSVPAIESQLQEFQGIWEEARNG